VDPIPLSVIKAVLQPDSRTGPLRSA